MATESVEDVAQETPDESENVSSGRKFSLNGKTVKTPSYRVKPGDEVSVKERSRKLRCFNEGVMTTALPPYLTVDDSGYTSEITHVPPRPEVPVVCDVQLVVEYYSR